MTVRFQFEWIDAGPSPDKLAQVTMAALRIDVESSTITAVIDRSDRRYSETINVPLFSVAEWLVLNWFSIWHEVADAGEHSLDFESRHNLGVAGDGFALPRLLMSPASSERMNLEWESHRPQHSRVEFLEKGARSVERQQLDKELRTLIEAVLQRTQENPETKDASEELRRVWSALNNLADDEVEFSRAAALFGADPFQIEDHEAAVITEFWRSAHASVREDALAIAKGAGLSPVADWLKRAQTALAQTGQHTDWPKVRDGLPAVAPGDRPWERGYELARHARSQVKENGSPIDLQQGPAAVPHLEVSPPSIRIQGFVGDDGPACVMAPRSALGKRFIQARALGDYLGRRTAGFGLLSSLATERQAESRAFAAEFLAPSTSLRQRISAERVDSEQIDDLAREFSVATTVIEHQIRNHRLAEVVSL
ncbi:MAG: hypothetical protein F4210_04345 [Holophagales bacterium]|nr:hypothetical protein [Holophagales bacterium]MYF94734.1 hypothetical protein [Holophagales bacterium]